MVDSLPAECIVKIVKYLDSTSYCNTQLAHRLFWVFNTKEMEEFKKTSIYKTYPQVSYFNIHSFVVDFVPVNIAQQNIVVEICKDHEVPLLCYSHLFEKITITMGKTKIEIKVEEYKNLIPFYRKDRTKIKYYIPIYDYELEESCRVTLKSKMLRCSEKKIYLLLK